MRVGWHRVEHRGGVNPGVGNWGRADPVVEHWGRVDWGGPRGRDKIWGGADWVGCGRERA